MRNEISRRKALLSLTSEPRTSYEEWALTGTPKIQEKTHFTQRHVSSFRGQLLLRVEDGSLSGNSRKHAGKDDSFPDVLIICKWKALLETTLAICTDQRRQAGYDQFAKFSFFLGSTYFLSSRYRYEKGFRK